MLAAVGLPDPERRARSWPHELSGGMAQRVLIAMALINEPQLVIADEPTTGLDVTVQAQILDLIARLRRELGMAVLLITHDLGVVAEFCDRVAVMYAGRIVEEAPAAALFAAPGHRYTEALLRSMPAANAPGRELPSIPGSVPPPAARGAGCAFAPRCGFVAPRCRAALPPLGAPPHRLRCWHPAGAA
jgi:oligopeptide/dipeptide ABC transporter ATP-binding protein